MCKASNIHTIVEPFISTIEIDGIEFDCYGKLWDDEAELRQVALKESKVDIYDFLNDGTIKWMEIKLQEMFDDGVFKDVEFFESLKEK